MFATHIKLRGYIKGLNGLQHYMKKRCLIQKRHEHSIFCEQQYQENLKIKASKEFPYNFISKGRDAASEEEKQEMMSVWPEVVESFVNACTDIPQHKEHLTTLLQENVYNYKQAAGILAVTAYKAFEDPDKLCPETIKLANILGCCANMLLSVMIITDDIVDCSEIRFGKSSWYARKGIGMTAVTDATILENGTHMVLGKYFSGNPCHFPVVKLFHEASITTAIGMSWDAKTLVRSQKPSLELFTMDIFKRMAEYKGSYPIYILPVTIGMYLAGKYDLELHRRARVVLNELGLYFIVQNDFVDCHGNPAITGKNGPDIQLGRCSWLIVEALQRVTSAQKQILSEHYGRPEYESEMKVKALYKDLGMLDAFLLFEEKSFNRACQGIQQMPEDAHKEFFRNTVEAVYGRKI